MKFSPVHCQICELFLSALCNCVSFFCLPFSSLPHVLPVSLGSCFQSFVVAAHAPSLLLRSIRRALLLSNRFTASQTRCLCPWPSVLVCVPVPRSSHFCTSSLMLSPLCLSLHPSTLLLRLLALCRSDVFLRLLPILPPDALGSCPP